MPELLTSYAELLTAAHADPLVRLEVGPRLLAPAQRVGEAVLFLRETQAGWIGAVGLGPALDLERLLTGGWRRAPGWSHQTSLTLPRHHRALLEALGPERIGEWNSLSIGPGELITRPLPPGVTVERGLARERARAFVTEHHDAHWITPDPVGELWIGLRDSTGRLVATGQAAYTPAGATRLTSIAVDRSRRGRGLGRAVTQELVDVGLERSPAVTLGVDEDNVAARALYQAMGFHLDHALVSARVPS